VAEQLIRHRRPGRLSAGHASRLAAQLTERDRRIALDCYDHRVLTSVQLQRLHFRSVRVAQRRLQELYELRVLERFRPPWQRPHGSTPYHWTLDEAGARIVSELLGIPRTDLSWSRDSALALAGSSKLAHQVAVNEFCSRLAEEARTEHGALESWWGERRARAALAATIAPDTYLRLRLPGEAPIELLLELDRGSEDHKRLADKARRYEKALPRSGLNAFVLLLVPSPGRAEHASSALARSAAPITVAVWTPTSGGSPLSCVRDAHARNAGRLDSAPTR
jgi:Replication-relaxation